MRYDPRRHLSEPKGLKAPIHPCVRRHKHIAQSIGTSGAMSVIGGLLLLMMYVNNASVTPPEEVLQTFLLIHMIVSWPVLFAIRMGITAQNVDESAMYSFRSDCLDHAYPALKEYGGRSDASHYHLKCIVDEHRGIYAHTRRKMMLRVSEAASATRQAVIRCGTADKRPAMEAYVATLKSIVQEAKAEVNAIEAGRMHNDRHEAIEAMHELTASLDGAKSLDPGNPATHGRPVVGSSRISNLMEMGERALALDPDAVDANGGRIDALVRNHLPRVLAHYADIATMPGGPMEQDRAMLDQAITMMGRSIGESLSSMRNDKADALRSDVRFLANRRGEEPPEQVAVQAA
jgi:hypothetical protein